MRRRGRAGSQLAKGRGRASGPKARKATTPRVPAAALQKQVDALTRELKDAREQQAATSEMLQVISGSTSELKPIFEGILKNATRICEATFGHLWLFEGNTVRAVAIHSEQSYRRLSAANP